MNLVVLGRVGVANPREQQVKRNIYKIGVSSPARLCEAGDLAGMSQLPQAHSAKAELAINGTRTTATAATGVGANFELRCRVRFVDECFFSHVVASVPCAVVRTTALLLAWLVLSFGTLLKGKAKCIE